MAPPAHEPIHTGGDPHGGREDRNVPPAEVVRLILMEMSMVSHELQTLYRCTPPSNSSSSHCSRKSTPREPWPSI